MKYLCLALILSGVLLVRALPQDPTSHPLVGRWDLTLKIPSKDAYPSWMEVTESAGKTEVRVVGQVSSVHPGANVKVEGEHLSFTTSEWFGKTLKVKWDMTAAGGKLTGTQTREDGTVASLSGDPAPALNRHVSSWKAPVPLFNGKDLTGWEPISTGEPGKSSENHYKAIGGELVNEAPGANIRTTREFNDFKLHVEFNCPQDGNSGVYLRGRYEVQVEYEPTGTNDALHGLGAIYGFLAPSKALPKTPGKWETLDVTLVGRRVTVVRDGVITISNREIPGITGGALNSREGEPGPIYIQGDHTGGMKYRNITISEPR